MSLLIVSCSHELDFVLPLKAHFFVHQPQQLSESCKQNTFEYMVQRNEFLLIASLLIIALFYIALFFKQFTNLFFPLFALQTL